MNWMYLAADALELDGLDALSLGGSNPLSMLGALGGLAIGAMIAVMLIGIVIFVYVSSAHMKIAKKAGQSESVAGTAWIPGVGTVIIPYIISGMHWWPWLLLTFGYFIAMIGTVLVAMSAVVSLISGGFSAMTILGSILVVIGAIALIVFAVFTVIWVWKMFKAVGRPGWWAVLPVILGILGYLLIILGAYIALHASIGSILTLVGALLLVVAGILYLVFIGIAAWGNGSVTPSARRR